VLLHVVDITGSLDKSGNRVSIGENDPYEDISFLKDEIDYWVKGILEREDWKKFTRVSREKKNLIMDLYKRLSGLKIKKQQITIALKNSNLEDKIPSQWTDDEILRFSRALREISKPILIVANKIDKEIGLKNLNELKKKYKKPIIPCSALAEHFLRKYHDSKKINYIPGSSDFQIIDQNKFSSKELETLKKIKERILIPFNGTGVQKVLNYAVFNILEFICVYPVYDINNFSDKQNNVLPDVFLIKKGTLLKEFVKKKIHSDLAKHFIYGINAKTKKRLGENYELKHNDIIKIVAAVK